VAVQDVVFIQE